MGCSFFMKLETRILIYLVIIAIVDMIIPIPFMAIFLIYILLEKPDWFKDMVTRLYHKVK